MIITGNLVHLTENLSHEGIEIPALWRSRAGRPPAWTRDWVAGLRPALGAYAPVNDNMLSQDFGHAAW